MAVPRILAIDQGTTNTKAVLLDAGGTLLAQASAPLASAYPQPGWAEQSASALWQSVQKVISEIVSDAGSEGIAGVAIANQRETLVTWDAETGNPIAPALLWQCRRTAEACARLHKAGANPAVEAATGLAINPLFPASKLGWVMEHVPEARVLTETDRLRAGTVDSWLLWQLTGGRSFATDHSNASRTQLFNTGTLAWDKELAGLFGAPIAALPAVQPSASSFGTTAGETTALPAGIPILAMMGDSHAALYGHGVRQPGAVKATYGTGSSLMALTPERLTSKSGLSGTIAWSAAEGVTYAIEGNITVSAQAASFMATLLGMPSARALSDLAQTVESSNGVTFVPALAGLGAPHWKDSATGTLSGMTLGSTPAHAARATFEAITLQIADVFHAMEQDIGTPLTALHADGGASANDFLMQLQADVLGCPVIRSEVAQVGAHGVAAMAFASLGIDPEAVLSRSAGGTRFEPKESAGWRAALQARWKAALAPMLSA